MLPVTKATFSNFSAKAKLDKDAVACTEAKNDQGNYEKTFSLARSISDKGVMSSTSPADALEFAMKKQLEAGRKNEDCYQIMNEIGKKVKIDMGWPFSFIRMEPQWRMGI